MENGREEIIIVELRIVFIALQYIVNLLVND